MICKITGTFTTVCAGGTFTVFKTLCIRGTCRCVTTGIAVTLSMYCVCGISPCLVKWWSDGRGTCRCITTGTAATLSMYCVCGISTCLVTWLSDCRGTCRYITTGTAATLSMCCVCGISTCLVVLAIEGSTDDRPFRRVHVRDGAALATRRSAP